MPTLVRVALAWQNFRDAQDALHIGDRDSGRELTAPVPSLVKGLRLVASCIVVVLAARLAHARLTRQLVGDKLSSCACPSSRWNALRSRKRKGVAVA